MRTLDFSSWQAILSTLVGIVVVSLVAVGIRLLVMQSVQQRRERQNRQINERLKTLIAAYKTLGGSFTGDLAVDPTHLRQARERRAPPLADGSTDGADGGAGRGSGAGAERRRRIRDAVEAALSDVILLGTQSQVRLAAQAASDMVAGRPVATAELVASLRDFIRDVLDLESVPADVVIPKQGPVRTAAGGGRSGGDAGRGGAGRGGGGAGAGGTGGGMLLGTGLARAHEGDAGADAEAAHPAP